MVACCFVFIVPESTAATGETSGDCGADLKWEVNTSNGLLTITGTGAMEDYALNSVKWGGNEIKSISLPNGLTTIGKYAFSTSKLNTTVIIPDSVTTIGQYAFSNCADLPGVTIGSGVTTIDGGAFIACPSITSIDIPDSVTTIGGGAFEYCPNLKNVTIGSGVTSISDAVFDYSLGIESFTVSADNAQYSSEGGVLFNKSKTTLVRYPAGKTDNSYTIPASVTTLGTKAFAYNDSLTSMTVPDSVNTIGNAAFGECMGLATVSIGSGVTSIDSSAFYNCPNLESFTVSVDNAQYSSEGGVLFNKSKTTLIQYPASKAGDNYTIPASVTTVGNWSFGYSDNLYTVTFPSVLTTIGGSAFYFCRNLKTVTIPDNVTEIGQRAFAYCTGLTTVSIGSGVTTVPYEAFTYCSSLANLTIGSGVTEIDSNAFSHCPNLKTVTIPDNVTHINSEAFAYCIGLTTVNIGSGVTSIHYECFLHCPNLESFTVSSSNSAYSAVDGVLFNKSITRLCRYAPGKTDESYSVPDTVTNIISGAFMDCINLTSIRLPAELFSIGSKAFTGCTNLEWFSIVGDNPNYCTIDGALLSKSKTLFIQYPEGNPSTSYTVPSTVTAIYDGAFANTVNLTSVNLPNGLTTIGVGAFSFSGIKDVYIPSTVLTINNSAFSFCPDLEYFSVSATNPNFCTIDGILYSKDKSQLIQCPGNYSGKVMIPRSSDYADLLDGLSGCKGITEFITEENSVYTVRDGALWYARYVIGYASGNENTTYALSGAAEVISSNSFYAADNLKEITTDGKNPLYSSKDGSLYSRDGKVLYLCPSGRESFEFSSDVVTTENAAFSGNGLTEVRFNSDSNVSIKQASFIDCKSLKKIVIEDGARVYFDPNSFFFTDNSEHTIYVVAPDGYTIDESCFRGNVKIIYGEPPGDSKLIWILVGGAAGVIVLAGVALFLIRHHKITKGDVI